MKLRTLVMLGAVGYGVYQAWKESRERSVSSQLSSRTTAGGI